ncbi:hypothetical protein [Streptomyces sp. NPDC017941]|uniref:hypothetical protein n=1 Tax=unclassified Streptomyces TaxID=2593676 RepID=UPI0037AE2DE4
MTDAPNGACMVKAKTRQWARAIERDLRGAGCKVQIHHPDLEQRTLIVSGTPDE